MVLAQRKDAEREFLIAGMYSDRARQFVTRLGWDLRIDEFGWEVDEYDDCHSEVIMVSLGVLHQASCRLRPAFHGTMLEDHFSNVFRSGRKIISSARDDFFELSRLVTSPDLRHSQRSSALAALLEKVKSAMEKKPRESRVFAVVFRQVYKLIKRYGIECICLEEATLGRDSIMLVEIILPLHRALDVPSAGVVAEL